LNAQFGFLGKVLDRRWSDTHHRLRLQKLLISIFWGGVKSILGFFQRKVEEVNLRIYKIQKITSGKKKFK